MIKIRRAIILIGLLPIIFGNICFAETRNATLAIVQEYNAVRWTVKSRNIRDVQNHLQDLTANPPAGGSDGVDDRAFHWDTINQTWIRSTNDWPFSVGTEYGGEAYAIADGQWDTYTDFSDKVSRPSEKWIAGIKSLSETLPAGYSGFTGLDCSGLVSRALALTYKRSTTDLTSISIPISTASVRKGDLFYRPPNVPGEPGHILMVTDDYLGGSNVSIIHAVTWRYQVSGRVQRVLSESSEFRIEDGKLFLRDSSQRGSTWEEEKVQHFPYSPFPQFQAIAPVQDSLIKETRPEIKVTLKSGTNIIGSEIVLKIDDVQQTLPSYANAKQIQVMFTPTENLSDGQHTLYIYAKNALNLEDNTSVTFTIGLPKFAVKDDSGAAIADHGFTNTIGINITGPAGTARLELTGADQQTETFGEGEFASTSFNLYYDGEYRVAAYDSNDALLASMTFTADRQNPYSYLTDASGQIITVAGTSTVITAHISDDGASGIARTTLSGQTEFTHDWHGETALEEHLGVLPVGSYTLSMYDRAGNSWQQSFYVANADESEKEDMFYFEGQFTLPQSNPMPPGYIGSLPDGGMYIAVNYIFNGSDLYKVGPSGNIIWNYHWQFYNAISGLATDGDGNVYVQVNGTSDNLYKFAVDGSQSMVEAAGYHRNKEYGQASVLASDPERGLIYALSNPNHLPGEVLVFDNALNKLPSLHLPAGMYPDGGIFTDSEGNVWVAGSDMKSRLFAANLTTG